jgi:hypothetical protein
LPYNRAKEVVGLKRGRSLALGGALLLLLAAGWIAGENIWRALTAPQLTALPALLMMGADVVGERPRPHALPLIGAGGLLALFMALSLGAAGMGRCLPYLLCAALFLVKAGLYPRTRGQRDACAVWAAALALAALYAANPLFLGEEKAARLRSVWALSVFPLLLSCALASTSRPFLAEKRLGRAALLLAAFVLMTLTMSQMWFSWFVTYRGMEGNAFAGATVGLYERQPLLLFALLELFIPAAMSYVKSSHRAAHPARRRTDNETEESS